jgi:hypothetical protein
MRLMHPKQTLAEDFLHFVKEAFGKRVYVFTAEGGEFLKQFLLLRAQVSRRLHGDPDMLIALLIALDILDALAFHAKHFARLGSGRDFHFDFAIQRRHIDFCT